MSKSQNCTGCFLVASPYLTDGHFFRSVVFVIRHSGEGAFGVVINRSSSKRFSEVVEMSSPTWQSSHTDVSPSDPGNQTPQSPGANAGQGPFRDQIYIGGPVEGPLLALHEIAGIGDPCGNPDEMTPGAPEGHDPAGTKTTLHDHPAEPWGSMSIQWSEVPAWMTADEDHLRILLRREESRLKFIVGYSGWGSGQLEHELQAGGWLVTRADADSIFDPSDDVWEKLVHRCGHEILKDLRPDLSFPDEKQGFDPTVN
ncbi:YqgE/AlgH family protein [Aporhodopirellula aestuarii]|uniref:YqgE/AlgH family protein n=1 Tax=Aporhodopirellula aestuarii TaxID=2950107 RepID=A0ABT0U4T6_9BACT|nr:YqgE/AlgH family protein [Aporhodopirellula aestuarii]MCM2371924.1 YqgE/AlgH family protein [Aporhodopirellula aestuarii]